MIQYTVFSAEVLQKLKPKERPIGIELWPWISCSECLVPLDHLLLTGFSWTHGTGDAVCRMGMTGG